MGRQCGDPDLFVWGTGAPRQIQDMDWQKTCSAACCGGVVWCGTVRCGVVQLSVLWCGAVCGAVWCSVLWWYGVVWHAVRCSVLRRCGVVCGAVNSTVAMQPLPPQHTPHRGP